MEAYGSQSELLTQGVNPAHLLGLMKEKEERDEFVYESDEEEEEEEKGKGGYASILMVQRHSCCHINQ